MNIKTPLRVDENGGIFDADGFVFIHRDSFGTGGQHHGDDERAEFQTIRAKEIVEILNLDHACICWRKHGNENHYLPHDSNCPGYRPAPEAKACEDDNDFKIEPINTHTLHVPLRFVGQGKTPDFNEDEPPTQSTDLRDAAELLPCPFCGNAPDHRDTEIERLNALFREILGLRSRHAKDCHVIARNALRTNPPAE